MGLRFRKSITLCKGVKLNFGKTGMSVSVGQKGFRKTYHTSGKVTTTVGIPGTGIYYTDVKNKKSKQKSHNKHNTYDDLSYQSSNLVENYDEVIANGSIYYDYQSNESDFSEELVDASIDEDNSENKEISSEMANKKYYYNEVEIESIYKKCDSTIEWTELMAGISAEELLMTLDDWKYYRQYAEKILDGDIDTYLKVIEEVQPLADLLVYAGDFEYGTDNPDYIEIEFTVKPEDVLEDGVKDLLFEKMIKSISIRIARDLMALLPVSNVVVHVVLNEKTILSVNFEKAALIQMNISRKEIEEIYGQLEHNIDMEKGKYNNVPRLACTSL